MSAAEKAALQEALQVCARPATTCGVFGHLRWQVLAPISSAVTFSLAEPHLACLLPVDRSFHNRATRLKTTLQHASLSRSRACCRASSPTSVATLPSPSKKMMTARCAWTCSSSSFSTQVRAAPLNYPHLFCRAQGNAQCAVDGSRLHVVWEEDRLASLCGSGRPRAACAPCWPSENITDKVSGHEHPRYSRTLRKTSLQSLGQAAFLPSTWTRRVRQCTSRCCAARRNVLVSSVRLH